MLFKILLSEYNIISFVDDQSAGLLYPISVSGSVSTILIIRLIAFFKSVGYGPTKAPIENQNFTFCYLNFHTVLFSETFSS